MRIAVVLFVLLLANISFAFTMNVSSESMTVPITGKRQLEISVYSDVDDRITFSIIGEAEWMLLSPSQLTLNAGERKNATLFLEPVDVQPMLNKQVEIIAESTNTDQELKKVIYISVVKGEGADIDKISLTGDLAPNGKAVLVIYVKNYGDITIQDIDIDISVSSPSKKIYEAKEKLDKLDPKMTKTIEKEFVFEKYAETGNYVMTIMVQGKTTKQKFDVPSKAVWEKKITENPALFGYGKSITISNYGNQEDKILVSEDISGLESLFYSGITPTTTTYATYEWLLTMKPGETVTISYNIDYSMLIFFILILIVVTWYVFSRFKTVIIRKYIMQKKFIEKGGEFTVGLNVKNGAGSRVQDVVVRDFVPSVFDVKDAHEPKPTKKKSEHGIALVWRLNDLIKNEERVLSYKIVPIFGVTGHVFLPTASVRFSHKNKDLENKSCTCRIGLRVKKKTALDEIFKKRK